MIVFWPPGSVPGVEVGLDPTPVPTPVPGVELLDTVNCPFEDEPVKLASPEYVACTE